MNKNNEYLVSALKKLHSKNEDFIIFGLTGRTGSGCTKAAEVLSTPQEDVNHSLYIDNTPANNTQRKEKIIAKYFQQNWQPFLHLRVSSVLTMMLLDVEDTALLQTFLKNNNQTIRSTDSDFLVSSSNELKTKKHTLSAKQFYIDYLTSLTSKIRTQLEEASFIKLYQQLGKNARRSGSVIESNLKKGAFFTIAEKTNKIVTKLRKESETLGESTYVCIDAIRNPLEASYFQERYASFYLVAVSCDENTRRERLTRKGLSAESIKEIDDNEYSSLDFDDQKSFTDQDLQGCLQRADIYVNSSKIKGSEDTIEQLSNQLIKFVSLAQKPGLITPSPEERCMQIAYTAKLNSGCLSRQVGAVVTKDNFSIKSVGWNDTPYGQVPCNLRSVEDLDADFDEEAYSPFERQNIEFKKQIRSKLIDFKLIEDNGYNHSYCFKSEYNTLKKDKNQVHTRSLHAEENAFLQISKDGGSGVEGGFLFTTASPCELCAKKAYQLGMTKIFYIDPYPGISQEHILTSGRKELHPEMNLFKGAIGRAFHNLYTPITAYKDELSALLTK
ncbi:deoxycytidylate deaminase [Vibrio sp. 404]|uniref:Deoxycytidylate deaminase n=1 Tax=Vibrio marinisediminis TaxID=2758441 RepID=A0A7W2IS18_9VIBR|nr:anti-phage dCTP deaminase [Vibrio marinisediminis]MBA5760869.1 deoxycytidylate deaminase [Vibrio marinisediminis]